MSKQKIIAFIVAIVIIIIGGIILSVRKEGEERAPGEAVPVEELSGFLPLEPIDWHNPDKPMQSWSLQEEEIPEEAIRIGMKMTVISPSSFEAKRGEKIVLSITSEDDWIHAFSFKDSSLAEVGVGLLPGETRAITFYAPKKAGEYEFFCNMPGHERVGEKGVMIVK